MKLIKSFLLIEIFLSFLFLLIPLKLHSQSLLSQKIRDRIDSEMQNPRHVLLNSGKYSLSKFNVSGSVNVLDSVVTFDIDMNQSQKLKYYYDEQGHVISIVTYTYANGSWQFDLKEDYLWDETGLNVGSNSFTWDGSSWANSVSEEIEYYSNGIIKEVISKTWSGTDWENEWWNAYEYNENGDGILWETFIGNGNNWDIWWKTTYTYDYTSHQYTRIDYSADGQQYKERYTTLYTYDAGNSPSRYATRLQRKKNTSSGEWENNTYRIAEWDDNGNNTVYSCQNWKNESWVNNYQYFRQYNLFNRLTSELYQVGDGSNWIDSEKKASSFDADGNITYGICEQYKDGQWSPTEGYILTLEGSYGPSGYSTGDGIWYDVTCYTLNGYSKTITNVESEKEIPISFSLSQNYPNPFNPETVIRYDVPKTSHITLKVYDILGREIAILVDEIKHPGAYQATFNANSSSLASGIYFCQMLTNNFVGTKKMILMK